MNLIIATVITCFIFIIFDFIWFSMTLSTIYAPKFAQIQGFDMDFTIKIIGGIFAWILLALGIQLFVVSNAHNLQEAFLNGLIFGFIVYGVYNGTNYSTLRDYDMKIFTYDLLWGAFVSALVSSIVYEMKWTKTT